MKNLEKCDITDIQYISICSFITLCVSISIRFCWNDLRKEKQKKIQRIFTKALDFFVQRQQKRLASNALYFLSFFFPLLSSSCPPLLLLPHLILSLSLFSLSHSPFMCWAQLGQIKCGLIYEFFSPACIHRIWITVATVCVSLLLLLYKCVFALYIFYILSEKKREKSSNLDLLLVNA